MEPTQSPTHKNIYVALAAAQAEFTPVAKNKTGKVSGQSKGTGRDYSYEYSYADLGDVLKMAIPVLSRHGICLSQPLTRKADGKLYLVTELHHGESETSKISDGLVLDEKQDAQDFGGDLTYWRRYDFTALAGIATEEDKDAQGKKAAAAPRGQQTGARPTNTPQRDPLEMRAESIMRGLEMTNGAITIKLQKYKGRLPQLIAELEAGAPTQEEPQATIQRQEDPNLVTDGDIEGDFYKATDSAPQLPLTPANAPAPRKHPSGCSCAVCLPPPRNQRPTPAPRSNAKRYGF